jgi:hypothetical protein
MSAKSTLALLIVSPLLGACAGYQVIPTGDPVETVFAAPPAGMSKVCVVRSSSKVLAVTAVVRDNGHLAGATGGESYFCYLAQPGEHWIVAEADRRTAEVDTNTKAGSIYYLKQDVSSGTITTIEWTPISDAEARSSARGLRSVALATTAGERLGEAPFLPASEANASPMMTANAGLPKAGSAR